MADVPCASAHLMLNGLWNWPQRRNRSASGQRISYLRVRDHVVFREAATLLPLEKSPKAASKAANLGTLLSPRHQDSAMGHKADP